MVAFGGADNKAPPFPPLYILSPSPQPNLDVYGIDYLKMKQSVGRTAIMHGRRTTFSTRINTLLTPGGLSGGRKSVKVHHPLVPRMHVCIYG